MNISEAIQKLETEWDMTDTDSFFFKVRDGEFDPGYGREHVDRLCSRESAC